LNPKLTAITCVYNGLPYLKESIESTLNQDYKDFKYLIIDDASPNPNVVKFIESYDDPRIKFIKNNQNLGTAKTFNKALSYVDTEYVVRIDQDDINLPNRFRNQISFLEKYSDLDIVCSWEHSIDLNGKIKRKWSRILDDYGAFIGYVLMGICPIWHPSIAFRTKSITDIGAFDAKYSRAEDFELTSRMALNRLNADIVPQYLLQVREHDDRQTIQYSNEMQFRTKEIHNNSIQFFLNHDLITEFSSFIRFENIPVSKKDKKHLIEYSKMIEDLFLKVKTMQNLSIKEMKTLRKTFIKRLGFGIIYCHHFKFLPKLIFHIFFNIFSPLSNPSIRKYVAKWYSRLSQIRYKFQ